MNQSTEMQLRDLLEKFLQDNPMREHVTIVIKSDNSIKIDTE
jgi:hypothetical protein